MESLVHKENVPNLKFAEAASWAWEKLATIPRTGWVRRGVRDPETVQEHTLSLRQLVIDIRPELIEFSDTDIEDIVDMLEVHDYPEAITGDEVILTKDPEERRLLKENKHQREIAAMRNICEGMGELGKEMFDLWTRYEAQVDPQSKFAREMDLYQCVEKSSAYQESGEPVSALEFITWADDGIQHPALRKRIEELKIRVSKI